MPLVDGGPAGATRIASHSPRVLPALSSIQIALANCLFGSAVEGCAYGDQIHINDTPKETESPSNSVNATCDYIDVNTHHGAEANSLLKIERTYPSRSILLA